MGKGSTILGLISLILGASALGLGGLTWLAISRVESQVAVGSEQTSWFKYNQTNFNTDPVFTYLTFSGLLIDFELGQNQSVYFCFSAQAHLEPSAGWSFITAYFKVDGNFLSVPYAQVGLFGGTTAHLSITLQHTMDDLSPGVHNISIIITGTSTGNYLFQSSLFVQKFLS